MARMKAIETHYKGYRFRSRLEARWAIWLDTLGIQFEYEPQGYVIDGEPYLPDFWLPFTCPADYPEGTPPTAGYYLEIKPTPLTPREEHLLVGLAKHTRHVAYAFAGQPWPGDFAIYRTHPESDGVSFQPPGFCNSCNGSGVFTYPDTNSWMGRAYEVECAATCYACGHLTPTLWVCHALHGFDWNLRQGLEGLRDYDVDAACRRARSARFEHGEKP